ncbi:transcriptional regulator, IclR-family [Bordetella petrii]|uniref:Transcriptional regulator, IclR-family n=1 Tax=Bordetella petrii (strain ATCC BAA-461 / DSM 12804 / CCUG 43448 / CIP 107267 / Se-1111R) TaxID=340100 RepID=A9I585_BORPD|nr:transcriptional regulator, IclR-family [Bordetella petrii]
MGRRLFALSIHPVRTASVTAKENASTSLDKAFEILDLFSLARPILRIEEISALLGYTRSTAYRYLKALCDAGLLAPSSGGTYALGPRIIELEHLLQLTDPLYLAGRKVLRTLHAENRVLLLHNLYRDQVLCIYKEGPDMLTHKGRRIMVRRARGVPFPLFQGAASLALLAYLAPHRVRQTYLRNGAAIAAAELGDSWDAFRKNLAAIRRRGYALSRERITPSLGGVAVPILLPGDKRVVGSLAQTLPSESMTDEVIDESARRLWTASEQIATEYARASEG